MSANAVLLNFVPQSLPTDSYKSRVIRPFESMSWLLKILKKLITVQGKKYYLFNRNTQTAYLYSAKFLPSIFHYLIIFIL